MVSKIVEALKLGHVLAFDSQSEKKHVCVYSNIKAYVPTLLEEADVTDEEFSRLLAFFGESHWEADGFTKEGKIHYMCKEEPEKIKWVKK